MNPWLEPSVAIQQRALVDAQLQAWNPKAKDILDADCGNDAPGSRSLPHFDALVNAVRSTQCPGSILEVGCGSGYGREILDRAGVEYASYSGIDINEMAIRIAKERYPESQWLHADAASVVAERQVDIAIDGSALLHIEAWQEHLKHLCGMTRRWIILHRVPVTSRASDAGPTEASTFAEHTSAYGQNFPSWRFALSEVDAEMSKHGFIRTASFPADGGSSTLVYAKARHWATYADRNYLGRLKALHASMLKHCAPFRLAVLAWDDDVLAWARGAECVTGVHVNDFLARRDDLALANLPGPTRTRVEHMWTVGPSFLVSVQNDAREPVTYVDSDILFMASPEPVFAEIGGAPAGVVPHGFAPASAGLPGPTHESHVAFGYYNVGIVHFASAEPAERWATLCREWCYDRLEMRDLGVLRRLEYGDQKVLEYVADNADAHAVRHPGACLGPWAIHARALSERDGELYFGGQRLIAYHYSSMTDERASRPEYMVTPRQEALIYSRVRAALAEASK